MSLSHKILFFLNSFSTGILTPVLTLVLCSHGANISTVSVFLGIFAVTVMVLEVPSGVFADLKGRKNTFLMSHIFIWLSFLRFSGGIPLCFWHLEMFFLEWEELLVPVLWRLWKSTGILRKTGKAICRKSTVFLQNLITSGLRQARFLEGIWDMWSLIIP